jgi:hypothetical protein
LSLACYGHPPKSTIPKLRSLRKKRKKHRK